MVTTRTESISAPDGGRFDAHLALPESGHGPGILVIQEIFGVNAYIRDVARRLADLGYVALAPDVFWRQEPGIEFDSADQANLEPAIAVAGKWDPESGLADLSAAFEHLSGLEQVTGPAGVIGFCFGGTQAFRLAQAASPACAVSYYGSGVPDHLDELHEIACPTLLHFGDNDPFIPNENVDAVKAAVADNHHVQLEVHAGGGHAFDNSFAPHFSQPEIAQKAWTETASFLYMHLGGPGIGA